MYKVIDHKHLDLRKVQLDKSWNFGDTNESEMLMHRIHSYPAKFPYFFLSKAINFYEKETGKTATDIADIFCGCGTLALESKKHHLNFWGCDINPVAVLIAKVKSTQYQPKTLNNYYYLIIEHYKASNLLKNTKFLNNERVVYWFYKKEIYHLATLKNSIEENVPNGKYRNFFLCAFSNILKPSSKWFTKSIKPQIDHCKKPSSVIDSFSQQYKLMSKANKDSLRQFKIKSKTKIIRNNIITTKIPKNSVDLIVSSPPYVVSYEYADIHQLSSLWLEYTKDYRALRKGSIGSIYQYEQDILNKQLPDFAKLINKKLYVKDTTKAKSVAKYFLDIDKAIHQAKKLLRKNGMAVFIIGNPKYKGILVNNVKFFVFSMKKYGFINIQITKRKISLKNLTPYRDQTGRFTKRTNLKKVYNHEFIITGRKSTAFREHSKR